MPGKKQKLKPTNQSTNKPTNEQNKRQVKDFKHFSKNVKPSVGI